MEAVKFINTVRRMSVVLAMGKDGSATPNNLSTNALPPPPPPHLRNSGRMDGPPVVANCCSDFKMTFHFNEVAMELKISVGATLNMSSVIFFDVVFKDVSAGFFFLHQRVSLGRLCDSAWSIISVSSEKLFASMKRIKSGWRPPRGLSSTLASCSCPPSTSSHPSTTLQRDATLFRHSTCNDQKKSKAAMSSAPLPAADVDCRRRPCTLVVSGFFLTNRPRVADTLLW